MTVDVFAGLTFVCGLVASYATFEYAKITWHDPNVELLDTLAVLLMFLTSVLIVSASVGVILQ